MALGRARDVEKPGYTPAFGPGCYLGIDPATRCGWALISAACRVVGSGTWDLSNRPGEGAGMRFLRLRAYLREVILQHRPVAVGYELVRRHGGPRRADGSASDGIAAAHVYGGCVAVLTSTCEEIGVPYLPLEVAHVKQHATGKGNAGKTAMIAAARERLRVAAVDDNEADAIWIADLTRARLDF